MTTNSSTAPSDYSAAPAAAARTRALQFQGRVGEVLGIVIVNALLTVLTLGIYYVWGKVKLRRYLWSKIELDGHALSFHGTGKELFVGWLKVVGVFVGAGFTMAIAQTVFGKNSPIAFLIIALYYLGLVFIVPFVIVAARRYLLSRTEWRGNRFSFRGDGAALAPIFFKGLILTMLTLGFYGPLFTSDFYSYLVRHSYYGTRRFDYDGDGRDLLLPYVKSFFLAFVTFGISMAYFNARQTRYLHSHTTYTSVRFDSTVTGGKLFWLAFTNMLLIFVPYIAVVGLGFGFGMGMARAGAHSDPAAMMAIFSIVIPIAVLTIFTAIVIATVRVVRFHVTNLVVRGEIDFATIGAGSDPGANAMGDEMANAMDVGAGLSL